MKKTWIRFVFTLSLAVSTVGLVGPTPESEAVLKCPPVYCQSLSCPAPCVRTLGRCTACVGGDGTPARAFRCVAPGGALCGSAPQYCVDPSCLG